jgi:hypothetical protein
MNSDMPDFDFLVQLSRENPDGFEAYRRSLLRQAVDAAPSRNRPALEELLLAIEARRECAASPMEAAVGAFQMMRQSVAQLQDAWQIGLESMARAQSEALLLRMR